MAKEKVILIIIAIIFITIFAHSNFLHNSFIWDDSMVIVDNNFVKSWKNFPKIFSRAYLTGIKDLDYLGEREIGSGETSYRPIVTMSYFIDYSIWKLNPFGYHLTNILLHIYNLLLVFTFVTLVTRNNKIGLLSALFFAIHPVNAEAVSVISLREDLFTFAFFLSSLVIYIKSESYESGKKIFLYLSSLVLFFLALLSKEMAITLPFVLMLYDYFFVFNQDSKKLLTRFRSRYFGYFLVTSIYIYINFFLMKNSGVPTLKYPGGTFFTNILTIFRVFAGYITWLLLPMYIHPTLPDDYRLISFRLLEPQLILAIILLAAIFSIALRLRKDNHIISFSIFWFFITLIPVANVIPLVNYMASRYLYLPITGFCLLISVLLLASATMISKKTSPSSDLAQRIQKSVLMLLVAYYCVFTFLINKNFKDNITFWTNIVRHYPENALAYSSLGSSFKKAGIFNKAIEEYKMALSLDPAYAKDHNDLGTCYYQIGLVDEAIKEFQHAIKLDNGLLDAYNNLGSAVGDKGRYQEAISYFEHTIKINPEYAQAYNNLGITYARMGKWQQARALWEKCLQIKPENKDAKTNINKLEKLTRQ